MAEDGAVLVNALNGVLRVTAGNITLEPHSRDYSFTQATAVNYEPEAGCTLFEKTLAQCLPDPEDRLLLQLFAGSILLPTSQHQVCLCSYGPSGTGKSTIAQAIANVFEPGTDSVAYLNLSHICDQKGYYLPKLHRAVLNLGAELDAVELEDSAVWKLLISGESMVVRPIYGAPFAMATTAKLWFLSNNLPRFKHGTDAELRRLRFLAFNQKPTNINLDLKEQLRVEAAGVLVWMIEGLCALLQRGGIPHGSATTRAIAETFRRQNDPLGSFVQEYCELSSDASILKADLQAAYVDYLSEIGLPVTLEASFYKNLWPRYPQLQETRPRSNGVRIRRIEGIQLRE
jgi:putative DNA primase/helicase